MRGRALYLCQSNLILCNDCNTNLGVYYADIYFVNHNVHVDIHDAYGDVYHDGDVDNDNDVHNIHLMSMRFMMMFMKSLLMFRIVIVSEVLVSQFFKFRTLETKSLG